MVDCQHSNEVLIARINKSDKIVESIIKFCRENNILSAWITGIGTVSEAKLAFYDLNKKTFLTKKFKRHLEIASLSGNVGLLNKRHVAHLHIVLSDNKMIAIGGHLEEATVAATCEIRLELFDHPIIRKHDEEIGLNLIQIK